MSKLPNDFIQFPNIKVTGTPEASNNKFVQGTIPNSDSPYGVLATSMPSKQGVNSFIGPEDISVTLGDSVLNVKENISPSGTPMGK